MRGMDVQDSKCSDLLERNDVHRECLAHHLAGAIASLDDYGEVTRGGWSASDPAGFCFDTQPIRSARPWRSYGVSARVEIRDRLIGIVATDELLDSRLAQETKLGRFSDQTSFISGQALPPTTQILSWKV